MNTLSTEDRADQALRELLAQADPEAGATTALPEHLLDRVLAASTGEPADAPVDPATRRAGRSFGQRHWPLILMTAAGVATLALAAGTVLPGLTATSSDSLAGSIEYDTPAAAVDSSAADSAGVTDGTADDATALESGRVAPEIAREDSAAAGAAAPSADQPAADPVDEALVRSGSVLVGTEEVEAARDDFVATVLAMGGRITSESVVTDGSAGAQSNAGGEMAVARDMEMSYGATYPYPWYPTGPGVWLTVQVPVEDYDDAMAAARDVGEVVQMQQSSYDVGAQVADVDARIAALEASLERLTALMDDAEDIGDVIALEKAISERQSELDGLKAQQRDLANQTAMSQISLTIMSPEDAKQSVDPQPQQSWWDSFLEGLGQFWGWLGQALLIVSPLLIAMGVIWWVRRRNRGTGGSGGSTGRSGPAGPAAPGHAESPEAPTE